ncbi:uncharacterized protein METZ01_LOCUS69869 [marine metagenome]|jgi:hypothetical protein|uniref:Nucleotide-diphospho-sugar transferase domain-containing protein n=1 Tax=marine metagenome TaxID=408172 RepID=A0A381TLR8_9ZZZZ
MSQSNKKGVLIFARNNAQIDYVKQAHFLAKRIKQYLDLPTSVVTDSVEYLKDTYKDYKTVFDQVIKVPLAKSPSHKRYYDGTNIFKQLEFKNDLRTSAFDLSPYDETLMLDSDYVVSDELFKHCFTQDHDFLIYKEAHDLSGFRNDPQFVHVSDTSVDFYWATCVFFRKTETNKIFFELTKHIQENWQHYNSIFQINKGTFRNDWVFSIAIHIMNGYQRGDFSHTMPGKMFFTSDRDILWELQKDNFLFLIQKEKYLGEYTPLRIRGTSVHVMNKFSLNRIIDNA